MTDREMAEIFGMSFLPGIRPKHDLTTLESAMLNKPKHDMEVHAMTGNRPKRLRQVGDNRPNGYVQWETTVTDEYECVFTPDEMDELGFAFINGAWSTEGPNGYMVADTLADAEHDFGSLVMCERVVTETASTEKKADSDA